MNPHRFSEGVDGSVKPCKWLVFFLCMPLLSGCWDRIEINDLALITATAIDKAADGSVAVSVQVFSPLALNASNQSGGSSSSTPITIVRQAKGVNIADAVSKIQSKLSRRLFFGHCKIYIFGEQIAKEGIADLTDFFSRHPEPRNRALIFVSKGEAIKVLQLIPPMERYSSEVLREMTKQHISVTVTLIQLQQMLRGKANTALLPLIDILPPVQEGKKSDTIPYLVGSALFEQGKMIGTITERGTRGIMWLRNEMKMSAVTVKARNVKGFITLNPIRERTKLEPEIRNGKWTMKVHIKTGGDVIENGTRLNLANPKWIKLLEDALREDIKTRIKMTLEQVQKQMKVDVLGFAEEFARKYPKEFKEEEERWKEVFSKIEVDIHVDASIKRTGLSASPSGIAETKVKE